VGKAAVTIRTEIRTDSDKTMFVSFYYQALDLLELELRVKGKQVAAKLGITGIKMVQIEFFNV
jgi:hypothetical protein